MNEETFTVIGRVERSEKLAFQQPAAAELLDVSTRSLQREIARRKLFPTLTLGLIAKEELLRYLREETQLKRRSRGQYRKRAAQTNPETN